MIYMYVLCNPQGLTSSQLGALMEAQAGAISNKQYKSMTKANRAIIDDILADSPEMQAHDKSGQSDVSES